jgi:hypothetical protein
MTLLVRPTGAYGKELAIQVNIEYVDHGIPLNVRVTQVTGL